MDFNNLAIEIYEQNKAVGWWDDPNRCPFECLQLVVTEIAEATEGERKGLMDDHLPHRIMAEVELADTLIRILDFAGRYGITYLKDTPLVMAEPLEIMSIGKRHFCLTNQVVEFARFFDYTYYNPDENFVERKASDTYILQTNQHYSVLLKLLFAVAETFGYDIEGATYEKLAYNKTRADHKRENRSKDGGKSF